MITKTNLMPTELSIDELDTVSGGRDTVGDGYGPVDILRTLGQVAVAGAGAFYRWAQTHRLFAF